MTIKEEILKAIEKIRLVEDIEEAHEIVRELSLANLEKGEFHIEALAYITTIQRLFGNDILSDMSLLDNIQKQVEESIFQPRSWAIKRDLTASLSSEDHKAYLMLKVFLKEISDNPYMSIRDSDKQQKLAQKLRKYCNRETSFTALPEIIIYNAAQILLLLPAGRGTRYKMRAARYNLLYSADFEEQLDTQLEEAKKLIDKLEGSGIIYLDIRMQPNGYVINIR